MKVKVIKNTINDLPAYQTPGSAGMDVRADFTNFNSNKMFNCSTAQDNGQFVLSIGPGGRALIPTGLRLDIPEGVELQIRARSGNALNYGVCMGNGVGTVDNDFKQEIGIILINHGFEPFEVRQGDRIAQFIFNVYETVEWEEVDHFDYTQEHGAGFGSTGKQ